MEPISLFPQPKAHVDQPSSVPPSEDGAPEKVFSPHAPHHDSYTDPLIRSLFPEESVAKHKKLFDPGVKSVWDECVEFCVGSKKWYLLSACVVAVAAFVFVVFFRSRVTQPQPSEVPAQVLASETATPDRIPPSMETGGLRANTRGTLSFLVAPGTQVAKGDRLFVIDNPWLAAEYQNARVVRDHAYEQERDAQGLSRDLTVQAETQWLQARQALEQVERDEERTHARARGREQEADEHARARYAASFEAVRELLIKLGGGTIGQFYFTRFPTRDTQARADAELAYGHTATFFLQTPSSLFGVWPEERVRMQTLITEARRLADLSLMTLTAGVANAITQPVSESALAVHIDSLKTLARVVIEREHELARADEGIRDAREFARELAEEHSIALGEATSRDHAAAALLEAARERQSRDHAFFHAQSARADARLKDLEIQRHQLIRFAPTQGTVSATVKAVGDQVQPGDVILVLE